MDKARPAGGRLARCTCREMPHPDGTAPMATQMRPPQPSPRWWDGSRWSEWSRPGRNSCGWPGALSPLRVAYPAQWD
jgi:hypothetical protein